MYLCTRMFGLLLFLKNTYLLDYSVLDLELKKLWSLIGKQL